MTGTRKALVRAAAARLDAAGVDDALDEARSLFMNCTRLDRAAFIRDTDDPVPCGVAAAFEALVARREAREPLSHILGVKPFWTLDLKVTPDVLTPRADTETVVEAGLEALGARFPDSRAPCPPFEEEGCERRAGRNHQTGPKAGVSPFSRGRRQRGSARSSAPAIRILDIGTGSGAILLALLSELPNATGVGADISPAALAVARQNAQAHGLDDRAEFIETSWADGVAGPFDLVVSNPPYIASETLETLDPEVRDYEPRMALDGGADGLTCYPGLIDAARRLLSPGGTAVFEIGWDQGASAQGLAEAAGASRVGIKSDLAGRDRALVFGFS